VVPAGSSLVSSISHPTAGFRPQLTDAAILTVVSAAPPSGSFRPPYAGTNKTHSWNKSSLNYNILRSLAPVASTPVLATVEATVERPQLEFHTSSFSQYTHPINNGPNYGREIAWNMADAVLSLHLNYTNAQKERLFIRVVQIGIDIYGCAAFSGGRWLDLDGINIGRKLPVVIAGLALNDPAILSYADATQHKATDGHFLFSEDGQTFVVTQADVGRLPYIGDGQTREAYIQADVGLPEWGGQHIHGGGTRDGRNWATMAYRDIAGAPGIATALSVHLTRGARAAWNWQPFFDYADRYILDPITGGGASILPFHQNMWNAYRGLASGPARNAVVRP
jgi:hypothetical protein